MTIDEAIEQLEQIRRERGSLVRVVLRKERRDQMGDRTSTYDYFDIEFSDGEIRDVKAYERVVKITTLPPQ